MSTTPTTIVFNTSNASGDAQITNVNGTLNINHTYQNDSEKGSKIYRWLDAPDSSGNYHTAREKHHAQTGVWFIEGEQFVHWKETPDSALWIYGTPGCGKTIICSTVIEDILNHCAQNATYACAYFFLDNRSANTELSLHHKVIRSIIRQLCAQSTSVPDPLVQMYGSGHQQPSIPSLKRALQQIIEGFKRTYILIDALDECTDREKLLVWIGELIQSKTGKIHLFLSSRREQDIEDQFDDMTATNCVVRVPLVGRCVDADIERYLDAMLFKMVRRWDAPTRARVKAVLVPGADGMFRWVALQIAELTKCRCRQAVETQLRSLPKDLDGVYDAILSKSENPNDLKQFLTWLAFSACPLDTETLTEVIMVDFSSNTVPFYNLNFQYFNGPKDMLAVCSNLVVEIEGIVKFSHMSVKDYILSNRIRGREMAFFGIDATLAQSLISQTCLAYLVYLGDCGISRIKSFPLAPYAVKHWISHMRLGCNDGSILQRTTHLFSLVNWVRLHVPDQLDPWEHDLEKPAEEIAAPLYYASIQGLHKIAQQLLKNGAKVDTQGGKYGSALQAASYAGHDPVVSLLLDHGVQVNLQCGHYGNALQAASHAGHYTVVSLLLDHGGQVNLQCGHYGNALQAASHAGHDAIVEMLLEEGANANFQDVDDNALLIASSRGHTSIVRLLLEKGVYVDAPCGLKGNALWEALHRGHDAIVRLLLDHGADVNAAVYDGCTALQVASPKGHSAVVHLLLEHGVDMMAVIKQTPCISLSYDALYPQARDLTTLITPRSSRTGNAYEAVFMGHLNDGLGSTTIVAIKHTRFRGIVRNRYTDIEFRRIDLRIRREILIWKRLNHKNVLELLGTIVIPRQFTSMISRWMENGNLDKFVTERLPLAHRLQITCDIAAGLAYQNILHGDLSPANILVDESGNACLSNCGLSSIWAEFEGTEFYPHIVGGALRFRALELSPPLDGDYQDFNPELTFACDMYSLGSVILQVLSSSAPYFDIHTDTFVRFAVTRGLRPGRPGCLRLTDGYWNYIQCCWASQPESRPSAAHAHRRLLSLREEAITTV